MIQAYAKSKPMTFDTRYHATREQILDEQAEIGAAQKDPRKFHPLYERYYERILSFVYQRLESKEDAYDVTQQVFINALENLPKYRPQGLPFSAWLFRIAVNELNKLFRRNKVRQAVNIDDEHVSEVLTEIGEENTAEKDGRLMKAIQQLEPDEIAMVEMRFFEKRPFKEISEILDITETAAKARVYRILERLKHMLTTI